MLAINPGGASLPVVDVLARLRAGLLFIDCERTAIGIESVLAMTRFAHAGGMQAVLRTPTRDLAALIRYLDCGVDGLVLPQVESARDCDVMFAAARVVRRDQAAGLVFIAQIETAGGHAALADIVQTPGVDLFLIGPNDLSHSMGLSGDTRHPRVQAAISGIIATLSEAGRPWGLPVTHEDMLGHLKKGCVMPYMSLETLLQPGIRSVQAAVAASAGQ